MEVRIQDINFEATNQLRQYIQKKLTKLERLSDDIQTADVYLKVVKPETAENKEVEITLNVLNSKLFASKVANTFEEATDLCASALEKQISKLKGKK